MLAILNNVSDKVPLLEVTFVGLRAAVSFLASVHPGGLPSHTHRVLRENSPLFLAEAPEIWAPRASPALVEVCVPVFKRQNR